VPDLYGVWAMRRPRGLKEKRRNLEKAVLITESIRKKGVGEAKAEEINRSSGMAAYTSPTISLLEG